MLSPVVHVPHDSREIPREYRDQFVLNDFDLEAELTAMTDAHTHEIFAPLSSPDRVLRFPVSRLLVDPERFEDDAQEPMSSRGMGVIYTGSSRLTPLRRRISAEDREDLLARFYRPHHAEFANLVEQLLSVEGEVLIIDAHSFPALPRAYELDQSSDRPEICLGIDGFHTPSALRKTFQDSFEAGGFRVAIDRPFAGSIVPMKYYRDNWCVRSIMVEINRSLYMDEASGARSRQFASVAERVRACVSRAVVTFDSE